MTDPVDIAVMNLLSQLLLHAFISSPTVWAVAVCTILNYTLNHGLSPAILQGLPAYGIICTGYYNDFLGGYEYGESALRLCQLPELKGNVVIRCIQIVNGFNRVWKVPLGECARNLTDNVRDGLNVGEFTFTSLRVYVGLFYYLQAGDNLQDVIRRHADDINFVRQLQQRTPEYYMAMMWQTMRTLAKADEGVTPPEGYAFDPTVNGSHFRSKAAVERFNEEEDLTGLYLLHNCQCLLYYHVGDMEKCYEAGKQAEAFFQRGGMGFFSSWLFYSTLAAFQLYPTASPMRQAEFRRHIKLCWDLYLERSKLSDVNIRHRLLMIEGEWYHMNNQAGRAEQLLMQALAVGRERGFYGDATATAALLTSLQLEKQDRELAVFYACRARECAHRWGALAVVDALEMRFSELIGVKSLSTNNVEQPLEETFMSISNTTEEGSTGSDDSLDLATIMKSAQSIAKELSFERLAVKLIEHLLENIGAERSVVVLADEAGLLNVIAVGDANGTVLMEKPVPLNGFANVSPSIVRTAYRTGDLVRIDDPASQPRYSRDRYVQANKPRVILVCPLITSQATSGVVFLENRLTGKVFTPTRMEITRLLVTQAAIAFNNSRLYTRQLALTRSLARFVPRELLQIMKKPSILEVVRGDAVECDMTVMFTDIRDFTKMSENMSAMQTIEFLNEYLDAMNPAIHKHAGVIDKFIGDAIMALFPRTADDALAAAVDMLEALNDFNATRVGRGLPPVYMGIGIHTGRMMVGTVGSSGRLSATAIGDAVNLASRIEGLTKKYNLSLLFSEGTRNALHRPETFSIRTVDFVTVKGKNTPVELFSLMKSLIPVIENLPPQVEPSSPAVLDTAALHPTKEHSESPVLSSPRSSSAVVPVAISLIEERTVPSLLLERDHSAPLFPLPQHLTEFPRAPSAPPSAPSPGAKAATPATAPSSASGSPKQPYRAIPGLPPAAALARRSSVVVPFSVTPQALFSSAIKSAPGSTGSSSPSAGIAGAVPAPAALPRPTEDLDPLEVIAELEASILPPPVPFATTSASAAMPITGSLTAQNHSSVVAARALSRGLDPSASSVLSTSQLARRLSSQPVEPLSHLKGTTVVPVASSEIFPDDFVFHVTPKMMTRLTDAEAPLWEGQPSKKEELKVPKVQSKEPSPLPQPVKEGTPPPAPAIASSNGLSASGSKEDTKAVSPSSKIEMSQESESEAESFEIMKLHVMDIRSFEDYELALRQFREGNIAEAKALLRPLRKKYPQDPLIKLYLDRCQKFRVRGKNKDWYLQRFDEK